MNVYELWYKKEDWLYPISKKIAAKSESVEDVVKHFRKYYPHTWIITDVTTVAKDVEVAE